MGQAAAASKPIAPVPRQPSTKPSTPTLIQPPTTLAETVPSKQDEIRRQARLLHDKLNGKGTIGTAFQKLCKLGVDAEWLERQLVRLQKRPSRSHKVHRKQDEVIRKTASNRLRLVARDLETLGILRYFPFVADQVVVSFRSPTTFIEGNIPWILREIANCIEDNHTLPGFEVEDGARFYFQAQPDLIAYLISKVRLRTSDHKPHFEELAVLISAATGREWYIDVIKQIDFRSRKPHRTK